MAPNQEKQVGWNPNLSLYLFLVDDWSAGNKGMGEVKHSHMGAVSNVHDDGGSNALSASWRREIDHA